MTRRLLKYAAAVAPAALLFAAGAPAQAKVLVMGDGGWEVSFDGSVNAFLVFTDPDDIPAAGAAGPRATSVGGPTVTDDLARVRTGLLPAVWGMNVKAPTTGGLDMAARIGLYPNISNNLKNTFAPADLDLREIFFTVDGAWGQILAGKTLSQFLGKNILTDMTLFGVGGVGAVAAGGGTTLGRIGYGYVYPQFNGRLQYTTPDMGGFKGSVGVYDPSRIIGGDVPGAGVTATETDTPRLEGELSYAGAVAGADLSIWVNGMWQEAEFSPNSTCAAPCVTGSDVTAWGIGGGLQVTVPVGPGSLQLTGSGYTGEALGLTLQLDTDSVDSSGEERENDGFIGQAVYSFGQGTSVGYSYGESSADETTRETANRVAGTGVQVESNSLHVVMLWHDVNPNWRLIAEYGLQETEWFDDADQDVDIFSVGTFFFW